MADLEKCPDTLTSPIEAFRESMKIEGTDNDLDHTQFIGADEVNLLGDGVPGYEATGEDGTDDEIEQQIEQQSPITPKFTP